MSRPLKTEVYRQIKQNFKENCSVKQFQEGVHSFPYLNLAMENVITLNVKIQHLGGKSD